MARKNQKKARRAKDKKATKAIAAQPRQDAPIMRYDFSQGEHPGAFDATVCTRSRHTGLSNADAKRQEAGSAIGSVFLAGEISQVQMEAGKALGELINRFATASGMPPATAQAMDMNRVNGFDGDGEDVERVHRLNKQVENMQALIAKVDDPRKTVWREVHYVCFLDRACTSPSKLRRGLDELL